MPIVRNEILGPVFEDTSRLEVGNECLSVVIEGNNPNELVLKFNGEVIASGELKFMRVSDQAGPHRATVFVSREVFGDKDRFGEKIEVELDRKRIC